MNVPDVQLETLGSYSSADRHGIKYPLDLQGGRHKVGQFPCMFRLRSAVRFRAQDSGQVEGRRFTHTHNTRLHTEAQGTKNLLSNRISKPDRRFLKSSCPTYSSFIWAVLK